MWVPPTRDPQSFSAWFERSFACVKAVLRRAGLVLLGLWALVSLLTFVAGVALFTSADGRELRDLIGLDDGFGTTNTLTTSQADRAGELFGDLLVAAIPWIIVVGVVYAIIGAWSWAIVAQVASHHLVESNSVDEPAGHQPATTAEVIGASLRRVPAVIGASLLFGLVFLGLAVLAVVPIATVIAIDIGTAAIVLTVLFVLGGVFALGVWLWGRLALGPVIAALGGHGVGLARSWEVTNGRFWYVVARLVVAALIAGALAQATSLAANFGFFLDFAVLLVISFLVQTVVSVVGTVIQGSAMVVALDQVQLGEGAEDD
jgi:hypothetical protein